MDPSGSSAQHEADIPKCGREKWRVRNRTNKISQIDRRKLPFCFGKIDSACGFANVMRCMLRASGARCRSVSCHGRNMRSPVHARARQEIRGKKNENYRIEVFCKLCKFLQPLFSNFFFSRVPLLKAHDAELLFPLKIIEMFWELKKLH